MSETVSVEMTRKETMTFRLREWFRYARENGFLYMVIVNSVSNAASIQGLYPVNLKENDETSLQDRLNHWHANPHQFVVCEIYRTDMDMDKQIAEPRAYHIKFEEL